jgi:hypothetical protein
VKQICEQNPETSKSAIAAQVVGLASTFPKEISRPSRGLFVPAGQTPDGDAISTKADQTTLSESIFYRLFADWLKDEGEASNAEPLGGNVLGSKWGTPDVIGTYKSVAGNVVAFPTEIISAEVKTEPQASIVAFGQVVAYRLFSTKTYIVMPRILTEFDKDRLESLCMLLGVGLVLFDLNKEAPNFAIRVRAQRFSPDMFFVNDVANRLKAHRTEIFHKLF